MAKNSGTQWVCTDGDCTGTSPKYVGRCPKCKKLTTMEERPLDSNATVGSKAVHTPKVSSTRAQKISDIEADSHKHRPTGIGELDRVLGGGLVAGGVILLAGPPGTGKALSLDTPILTANDWQRFGDLATGDIVFDEKGATCRVVAVKYWDDRPCYEITFTTGEKIVADENHEWQINLLDAGADPIIMTTGELFAAENYANAQFPVSPALEASGAHEPWSYYRFGEWVDSLNEEGGRADDLSPAFACTLATRLAFMREAFQWTEGSGSLLHRAVKGFGKACDLANLARSVGWPALVHEASLDGTEYIVEVSTSHIGPKEVERFGMEDLTLANFAEIESIRAVEPQTTMCIEVDSESHLFLVGETMIPTHNSSLLAIVADQLSAVDNVLYISGEETIQQIKIRHERMNAMGKNLYLASESDLAKILWHIEEVQPSLLIIDSLQTVATDKIDGRSGSVSQMTEVAQVLTDVAKKRHIPTIFIGHYTKDGNIAGPRVVEHMVDAVLAFEGEEDSPLRILRGIKNRFGAADEIGCFEHTETGLQEVADPSGLLLGSRNPNLSGVATSIFLEGKRALPVEIQALVTPTVLPNPRKIVTGMDSRRILTLQAVMQKHASGMRLGDKDVFVSTMAGMSINEPAVDLASVIAMASSMLGKPARQDAVNIGEVTLSGEIRMPKGIYRRLNEASRLDFKFAHVPVGTRKGAPKSLLDSGLVLIEYENIRQAIKAIENYSIQREALG